MKYNALHVYTIFCGNFWILHTANIFSSFMDYVFVPLDVKQADKNFKKIDSPLIKDNIVKENYIRDNELSKNEKYNFTLQAIYAGAAYCQRKKVKDWTCANCYPDIGGIEVTEVLVNKKYDTFGYVGYNNDTKRILISYRGTYSKSNMKNNYKVNKVQVSVTDKEFTDAKIHAGFNLLANTLLEDTINSLKRLKTLFPSYKVSIVGHSMGGAMASIVAFRLAENNILKYSDMELFTFGQPRVGNDDFSRYISQQDIEIYRVTTTNDFVPMSPPRIMGYSHFRREYFIGDNLETRACDFSTDLEDGTCSAGQNSWNRESHFNFWDYKILTTC